MTTETAGDKTSADVAGQVDPLVLRDFDNGMTVRELKELIKVWPETNQYGEDCEVWIETGHNLSSPVTTVGPLNRREDDAGNMSADLILESNAFDA
jgi:hypothetical protein